MTLEIPKPRALPESKKTLKFVPDTYSCNSCGVSVPVEEYLDHLNSVHKLYLNRRICVHGPIYNDRVAWKRTGENCWEHKLLTIMNDGRFPGYKKVNGSDNSTDGSVELIKSYPNTMYFAHGEDYEEAKFNFAMHLAAKMGFEYVILLGSDEWMIGNIQKLLDELDKRMIRLPEYESQSFQCAIEEHQPFSTWNRFITESPKIYYGPGLLRTRFCHWLRYSATQNARKQKDQPLEKHQRRLLGEKSVVIHHDDAIRGKDGNKRMTLFQNRNVIRERNIIAEKVFKTLKIMNLYPIERSEAEKYRESFADCHPKFTHILIYEKSVKLKDLALLEKKLQQSFDESEHGIISAVYQLDNKRSWRISHDPLDKKFPTQKMFDIYNKTPFDKKEPYHRAIHAIGPFVAIKRDLVHKFTNLSDFDVIIKESILNDIPIFVDSRIQVKL